MKKKLRILLLVAILTLACATTSLACTPKLATPKLPAIPNISSSISIPQEVTEAAKKAGVNAAKNLKIDLSKIKFKY